MLEGFIGFLAGIISSMGFGGGSILLIYLTLFEGVPQREAAGINLIYFLPCATVAVYFFLKSRYIKKEPVFRLMISSAIGAALGAAAALFIEEKAIRILFSLVILGVGIKGLFCKPRREEKGNILKNEIKAPKRSDNERGG